MRFKDYFTQTPESSEEGTGSGPPQPGLDEAAQMLRRSKTRLGGAEQRARAEAALAELDKLYTPENFKGLYSIYFNYRFIKTGDECFLLSPAELDAGCQLMATSARLLIKIDPGYVAVIMLGTQMAYLIASKESAHFKHLAQQGPA
jgi:hypothetical protein